MVEPCYSNAAAASAHSASLIDVQLIHAETDTKFQQHTKDGRTFCEVEPNVDYWIQVTLRPSVSVGKTYLVSISVDGQKLGYYIPFSDNNFYPTRHGIFKKVNGHGIKQALHFAVPYRIDSADELCLDDLLSKLGKIEVDVTEGIYLGYFTDANDFDTFREEKNSKITISKDASKVVRSSGGQATKRTPLSNQHHYAHGAFCERLALYYCCTPALQDLGILHKPERKIRALSNAANKRPLKRRKEKKIKVKNERGLKREVALIEILSDSESEVANDYES